ncbi:pyridoxamine 5'-phosphate oxidase family protein [Halobacteriaceae archaeon SHR40]|uniref:pyridoxamine 5'-phosphate oxidase family protein n=1 Tax=Halovenus amylolytica TaxID=2500550 RepID=UPI000FE3CBB6
MPQDRPITMTDEQRDEFLGNGGTGVLSLSAGEDSPHSVPVSYGYDSSTETFYFRLAVGADSSKADAEDSHVSFVTYDETDEGWQSVVAQGQLEGVESEGIEVETLAGLDRVDIPLVDIFEGPIREISFEFYRLVPDELTGRVEA